MSSVSEIHTLLSEEGIELSDDLVADLANENKFYAFVKIARNSKGHQRPSNYSLRQISEKLEQAGLDLSFIIIESEENNVLATIKAGLARRFPEMITNAFLTMKPTGTDIWIEPRSVLNNDQQTDIQSVCVDLMEAIKSPIGNIFFTTSANLPTSTACLKSIRKLAPVSLAKLSAELEKRGFEIPSEKWLARTLDKLRKSKNIIRLKESGEFALTLQGLQRLGSGKDRRSPDIVRALDLARRDN